MQRDDHSLKMLGCSFKRERPWLILKSSFIRLVKKMALLPKPQMLILSSYSSSGTIRSSLPIIMKHQMVILFWMMRQTSHLQVRCSCSKRWTRSQMITSSSKPRRSLYLIWNLPIGTTKIWLSLTTCSLPFTKRSKICSSRGIGVSDFLI